MLTLTDLLQTVIRPVVHGYSATVVHLLVALDTSQRAEEGRTARRSSLRDRPP